MAALPGRLSPNTYQEDYHMVAYIRALIERFRARFIADAGLDFEAQLIARDAERKAVLLRKASLYDSEGLHSIAKELRQRAEGITFHRPLSTLLPPPSNGAEHRNRNGTPPKLPARSTTSSRNS